MWMQKEIILQRRVRGFHLITSEIVDQLPELNSFNVGLAHFFIQHTSASLAINENADPSVRTDMEEYFSRAVAENQPYFTHTLEGSVDMPAHLKNMMIGSSQTLPVAQGKLLLGVWQGLYLCEHRNHAGSRHVVVTLNGE